MQATDSQLLFEYAEQRSEPAFAELVRRHIDLVYSAARRMVLDDHLAEDVTQRVFLALAQQARGIRNSTVLAGWLHRTAQNIAAQTVRTEVRRREREKASVGMDESFASGPLWQHLEPHLDRALGALRQMDRDALLLRYFERKSARQIAELWGVSEEAAQKRVNRALERLRDQFAKCGLPIGASSLAAALGTHAVQAAPAAVLAKIAAGVTLASAAHLAPIAIHSITQSILMTTIQKSLITVALAASLGTAIYETRKVSHLEAQLQATAQTDSSKVVATLTRERDELKTAMQQLSEDNKKYLNELPALRGEVARLRGKEMANAAKARRSTNPAEANSQDVSTVEEDIRISIDADLQRLKNRLNLSPAQEAAVRKILTDYAVKGHELTQKMPQQPADAPLLKVSIQAGETLAKQMKEALDSEQLNAYVELRKQDWAQAARASASHEVSELNALVALSQEQQDKALPILYEQVLSEKMGRDGASTLIPGGQYPVPVSIKESINLSITQRENRLSGILTADQLELYRKMLAGRRDQVLSALPATKP